MVFYPTFAHHPNSNIGLLHILYHASTDHQSYNICICTFILCVGNVFVDLLQIPVINPVRFAQQPERKPMNTYARIRPKLPTMPIPIIPTQFNGFNMNNNSFHNFGSMQVPNNDTLNLSLDSLTQVFLITQVYLTFIVYFLKNSGS